MEVVYFCLCGKARVFDQWSFPDRKIWNWLNSLVLKENLELRIAPHLCPECFELWQENKERPIKFLFGGQKGENE